MDPGGPPLANVHYIVKCRGPAHGQCNKCYISTQHRIQTSPQIPRLLSHQDWKEQKAFPTSGHGDHVPHTQAARLHPRHWLAGCSVAAEILSHSPVLPLAPRCQQSILSLQLCLLVSVLMQLGFSSPCFLFKNKTKQTMDPKTQHKSPFCRQLPPLSLRNGTALRDVPSFCYSLPKVSGAILPLSRALCGGRAWTQSCGTRPPSLGSLLLFSHLCSRYGLDCVPPTKRW